MKDRPLLVVTLILVLTTVLVTVALGRGGSQSSTQFHPYQIAPDAKGGLWIVDANGNTQFKGRPGG